MNKNLLSAGKYIFRVHDKLYEKVLKKYNLTNLELNILFFLKSNCEVDTARDMAEKLNLSKSNISDAVDSLTKKGYLMGVQDEKDRRYIHLKLQNSVDIILDEAFVINENFVEEITKDIPQEKLDIARDVLEEVLKNVIKKSKSM